MKTTRQRILGFLTRKGSASALDVSLFLNTTSSNARHHLAILLDEGTIVQVGHPIATGRGRPVQLYALASQELLNNFSLLSSALLSEFKENHPPNQQSLILANIARRLANYTDTNQINLVQSLIAAVNQLNMMGYQAKWEAHVDSPKIKLHHCPYSAILDQHPELCQIDAYLIESYVNTPVELVVRLGKDSSSRRQCIFNLIQR